MCTVQIIFYRFPKKDKTNIEKYKTKVEEFWTLKPQKEIIDKTKTKKTINEMQYTLK